MSGVLALCTTVRLDLRHHCIRTIVSGQICVLVWPKLGCGWVFVSCLVNGGGSLAISFFCSLFRMVGWWVRRFYFGFCLAASPVVVVVTWWWLRWCCWRGVVMSGSRWLWLGDWVLVASLYLIGFNGGVVLGGFDFVGASLYLALTTGLGDLFFNGFGRVTVVRLPVVRFSVVGVLLWPSFWVW
ncbi:hypothetical protein TSUD_213740 [Trifolium subterraneum]|uniref:Transmembrane protein n=1 Tax=Trifolium subterraneum TaxID=3900 RepID=A0A2Z6NK52_TRISU|nr:hypothetical protein TSUD_213740 [Trifolium subterraneum]